MVISPEELSALRSTPQYINGAAKRENSPTAKQDKEAFTVPEYLCPDRLWRGPFAKVAEIMGKQTWEIWAGVLTALAARAHKNIHWQYHRALYAMTYLLLIKPTGLGKGLAADVCADLMPSWYTIRDAVQSGPALAPILADIKRDGKGRIESISPRPVLLLIEEWTTLLRNAAIQGSTLVDILNSLFHRTRPWNVSRSDRPGSGGGDVVIENPRLTILATTTKSLLKSHIDERLIRSGFLNRYLVLPGSSERWQFFSPDAAGIDTSQLKGLLDSIPDKPWGMGANVWLAYDDDARECLIEWGRANLEPLMNDDAIESEAQRRLHVYLHIIALLYAWAEQAEKVSLAHVECSIAAVETSRKFLDSLMREEGEIETPKFKSYEIALEGKILAKVMETPNITFREVVRAIAGKKATSADVGATITKLLTFGRLVETKGKGKNPARLLSLVEESHG